MTNSEQGLRTWIVPVILMVIIIVMGATARTHLDLIHSALALVVIVPMLLWIAEDIEESGDSNE